MLLDTTKSKANLAIPTNLKAIILHRFQSIASALTPLLAACSSLIMALPFVQARSGSPPADNVPGVTNPISGRSNAPASSPTGQPRLAVELPAGSTEEPLSGAKEPSPAYSSGLYLRLLVCHLQSLAPMAGSQIWVCNINSARAVLPGKGKPL